MAIWEIEEHASGKCDITRDRRSFFYDVDDMDEAVRMIRRSNQYHDGDEVFHVEPDGYRTVVRL